MLQLQMQKKLILPPRESQICQAARDSTGDLAATAEGGQPEARRGDSGHWNYVYMHFRVLVTMGNPWAEHSCYQTGNSNIPFL